MESIFICSSVRKHTLTLDCVVGFFVNNTHLILHKFSHSHTHFVLYTKLLNDTNVPVLRDDIFTFYRDLHIERDLAHTKNKAKQRQQQKTQNEHEHEYKHVYARIDRWQPAAARVRDELKWNYFIIHYCYSRAYIHAYNELYNSRRTLCVDIGCAVCIVLANLVYIAIVHTTHQVRAPNKIVLYPKNLIINFSIVSNIVRVGVQYTNTYTSILCSNSYSYSEKPRCA